MNSSSSNASLPTWIFIVTDVALIATGAAIAIWSPHPLAMSSILWIVACVGLGTLVLLIPLVARYERQKNEALDERQTALEALARIVESSAQQISIATKGLHDITEVAQKNLRLAEQLPHKLQEKIAEFQAQLATAVDAEKEELERELLSLRTTESERLESVSQRIAKSAAEWTKLEAATQQQLTSANEAIAKLAFGNAGAIGKAQAAAEQAFNHARQEANRSLAETSAAAMRAIDAAKSSAVAELDTKLTVAAGTLVQRVMNELTVRLARLEIVGTRPVSSAADLAPAGDATGSASESAPAPRADTTSGSIETSEKTAEPTQTPRRVRKPRREELSPDAAGTSSPSTAPASTEMPASGVAPNEQPSATSAPEEPLPIPAATFAEITPVVPGTAEPFSGNITTMANGNTVETKANSGNGTVATPEATSPKAPRKRSPKPPADADIEPALGLELDDSGSAPGNSPGERILTSDGATRLLVTAYIGIGNRLFIRGSGPGLSWEKGVPLQFVSIGKWRWETNDATAPVQFKVYKNDEIECASLGTQSLDPGHQDEVTAAF